MLTDLHVKNLALISEEEISFGEGFNILTGETGAGKSVILGSVDIAMGGKYTKDVIRTGEESSLIELTFRLNEKEIEFVKGFDIYPEDDNTIVLSRKIMPGKSVCRINGETVSAGILKDIAGRLINMYGQHDNQTLLKKSSYLMMLDEFAGQDAYKLIDKITGSNREYRDILSKINSVSTDESLRKKEAELLSFEIKEITDADLKAGEDEELEKKFRLYANAQKLREAASEALIYTGGEGNESAYSLIGRALQKITSAADLDDDLSSISSMISSAEDIMHDVNRELTSYIDSLEFDEEDCKYTEERLNTINHLKDKYGASVEDILVSLSEKEDRLSKLNDHDGYLSSLNKKKDELYAQILDDCRKLSGIRKKASPKFEEKLISELSELNFENVGFRIDIKEDADNITDQGFDDVDFLISLNAGEDLKPMQNVASGGELSRIMLAVKSIFASKDDVSTLIFDEIDAGISGVTAYKVSRMMGKLSKKHQIICITHLPQIAAMADKHFLIEKNTEADRTLTHIKELSDEGAVREVSRLLGSDTVTDAAIENARELIQKAKGEKL